ncbi:acyl-ACP thioesterase [Bacteriovorax sp. BSW11_IV]|uniref:acyl-[acyl-carrier-protein] thioesterase n=1 Tax=Bacteriovorax sp. BSW11_IV TaxID=1353529 RepID=UPI00038A3972|nr:acyl-ACP thioesterase domain-containing protein [Bacteriovorax sp. BSW11_IV]EQC48443.1 acyl-ACP thioesterase [Bacteriovorax sp. BSW11_IV]
MIFGEKDNKFLVEIHLNADDVNYKGELTLKKLMLLFQKVALVHYTTKAENFGEVMKNGKAWVLTKIEIQIDRIPMITEDIIISTWSRGADGHKGLREFIVTTKEGTPLIHAQTQWAYLNFKEKKLAQFDASLFPRFKTCDETHFKEDIARWRLNDKHNTIKAKQFQLRQTDFDINRHLNNTTYFELLEDYLMDENIIAKSIYAAYAKEVPMDCKELSLYCNKNENESAKEIDFHLENEGIKSFMAKIKRQ